MALKVKGESAALIQRVCGRRRSGWVGDGGHRGAPCTPVPSRGARAPSYRLQGAIAGGSGDTRPLDWPTRSSPGRRRPAPREHRAGI